MRYNRGSAPTIPKDSRNLLSPSLLNIVKKKLRNLVKPDNYVLAANVMTDLTRSRSELILENAFLPQQLIVKPDTLIRWHRDLYRWLWKRKSKPAKRTGVIPPISL